MKAARLPSGLCREATTRQRFGLYHLRSPLQTWLTACSRKGEHTSRPGRSAPSRPAISAGSGLDLMVARLAPYDQPCACRGGAAERRGKAGIGFHPCPRRNRFVTGFPTSARREQKCERQGDGVRRRDTRDPQAPRQGPNPRARKPPDRRSPRSRPRRLILLPGRFIIRQARRERRRRG